MKTVLVVDDFQVTRNVMQSSLEKLDIVTITAADGEEAISKLIDSSKVDLLITDLNMPKKNGIELTQFVRNDSIYGMLPILLLTTDISKEKKQAALNNGVTAILSKPYDSKQFQMIVKKLLKI